MHARMRARMRERAHARTRERWDSRVRIIRIAPSPRVDRSIDRIDRIDRIHRIRPLRDPHTDARDRDAPARDPSAMSRRATRERSLVASVRAPSDDRRPAQATTRETTARLGSLDARPGRATGTPRKRPAATPEGARGTPGQRTEKRAPPATDGRTCETCGAEKTSRWRRMDDEGGDATRFRCKACFQRERRKRNATTEHVVDGVVRACVECGETKCRGEWVRVAADDPARGTAATGREGGALGTRCAKCYERARKERRKNEGALTRCEKCGNSANGMLLVSDPSEDAAAGAKCCHKCYHRTKNRMRKLRDERTCADCRKAKRTEPDVRWYRSKETGPEGEPVWTCHQCFSDRANHPDLNAAGAPRKRMPPHKNGGKKAQKPSSAPPRHCPSCDRTKQSSQWRKSGEHTVCTACYQRHLRARKYRQREPVGTFAI